MIIPAPVLVVGGSRGTGLLVAQRLQRQGQKVRVLARDPARAKAGLASDTEVIAGDITRPDTLPPAVRRAGHIVFTAGVRSGHYAPERVVRATDHDGVVSTLAAARASGLAGRFVYMNSFGVNTPSIAGRLLNLLKRNTLVWRSRVEDEIRASGLDYVIVRAGFLFNRPAGQRVVRLTQDELPLSLRYRISRSDVANAIAEALNHPNTSRVTMELAWSEFHGATNWAELFRELRPDADPGSSSHRQEGT